VIGSVAVQGMLGGMPDASDLRRAEVDGQVVNVLALSRDTPVGDALLGDRRSG
jgi:hypothetical protein